MYWLAVLAILSIAPIMFGVCLLFVLMSEEHGPARDSEFAKLLIEMRDRTLRAVEKVRPKWWRRGF